MSDGAAGLSGELWDVDRLAAYLGVGRRFVYRLTHERRIRHVKVANQFPGALQRPRQDRPR